VAANDNTYNPRPVPPDFNADFLDAELKAISNAMGDTLALELRVRHAIPIRPREGMIVYADGTVWNPGSGKGWYGYNGTTWVLIKVA
jgi:hypothetical protein